LVKKCQTPNEKSDPWWDRREKLPPRPGVWQEVDSQGVLQGPWGMLMTKRDKKLSEKGNANPACKKRDHWSHCPTG